MASFNIIVVGFNAVDNFFLATYDPNWSDWQTNRRLLRPDRVLSSTVHQKHTFYVLKLACSSKTESHKKYNTSENKKGNNLRYAGTTSSLCHNNSYASNRTTRMYKKVLGFFDGLQHCFCIWKVYDFFRLLFKRMLMDVVNTSFPERFINTLVESTNYLRCNVKTWERQQHCCLNNVTQKAIEKPDFGNRYSHTDQRCFGHRNGIGRVLFTSAFTS